MDEIRIGVVGAAGRGHSFANACKSYKGVTIDALCDLNEEGVRKLASEIGVTKVYTDYEEMLDKSGINAVVVGTPMPLHVPQSIAALQRDISVMSEVPASVSIEESKDLVLAVKRSKGKYMMAENYTYIKECVLVKHIVKAGLFGTMYFGEGEYLHELKGLNEITKWRRKWQTGINGVTYPTHSLGPVLQWMGERIVSAMGVGTGHHYQDPRGDCYENEDSCFLLGRTDKGGLIKVRVDMLSDRPHGMAYYSLQGTDGCYEAPRGLGDDHKIWLKARSKAAEWMPLKDLEREFLPDEWLNPPPEALEAGHWGGDYWQVRDFVEAVREGKEPPIGIHEAMDMTLPGLISQISIENGCTWMDVPDSRKWWAEG